VAGQVGAIALAAVAQAQNFGGWNPQRFADAAARLQGLPPEERIRKETELFSTYALDQAWALTAEQGTGGPKPAVKIIDSGLPIHVHAGTLHVPEQFYPQMMAMALLIGHDAAVDQGKEIPVPQPLLYRPLGEQRLLGTLPNLGGLFEPDNFLQVASIAFSVACGPTAQDCMRAQAGAVMCATIFVIAHEVTHIRRRHKERTGGAYEIDEELQADQGGVRALQQYLRNLQAEGEVDSDVQRDACMASPAVFFELNRRRSPTEATRKIYQRRRDAVLAGLGKQAELVKGLLEEQTKSGGIGRLQVAWSELPKLLLLDGVEVEPRELKNLLVPAGTHRMVVTSSTGIAVADVHVSAGRVAQVKLAMAQQVSLPSGELAELARRRLWPDVLRATSDSALRPKSKDVAVAHWTALRGLGLGAWIDMRDVLQASGKDARNARRWQVTGQPLTGWAADVVSPAE
jgi:hypothetical protein